MNDQAPLAPDEAKNPGRNVAIDRADLAREISALVGAACFVVGVFWIYKPAGLIVLGLIIFGWAYVTMTPSRTPIDTAKDNG